MNYNVVFSPEADEQLLSLYHWIAKKASPETAFRYTQAIISYCEGFCTLPTGFKRDDLRPGLMTRNYEKRVVIAFYIDDGQKTVFIIGIFYGGQDYEVLLQETSEIIS
jgi:toxin ParE1/3/4